MAAMTWVTCTNKGQHRELDIREYRNGRWCSVGPPEESAWWRPFGYWTTADSDQPLTNTQRFKCRRCGRDTRLSPAKLNELLDRLHDTPVPTLDISYLPY
ncbi:MAG TPA: hypothetical protein VFA16_02790 [Mycobacterium sp.]|nr:hypothetical protein [Mycobacterium sp.]